MPKPSLDKNESWKFKLNYFCRYIIIYILLLPAEMNLTGGHIQYSIKNWILYDFELLVIFYNRVIID